MNQHNILSAAACGALALAASSAALAQHQPPGAYADLAWRMIGPMRGGRMFMGEPRCEALLARY